MEKFIVTGGNKLKGTVRVSGAKNAALKALIAACLTDEEVIIKNIPLISDFLNMISIIKDLGGEAQILDLDCVFTHFFPLLVINTITFSIITNNLEKVSPAKI